MSITQPIYFFLFFGLSDLKFKCLNAALYEIYFDVSRPRNGKTQSKKFIMFYFFGWFLDLQDSFFENVWYDFFSNVVSSVFIPDASTLRNFFYQFKRCFINVSNYQFDEPTRWVSHSDSWRTEQRNRNWVFCY